MPMTHADFMRACHLTELLLRKANPDLRAERCPGKEFAPNHLAWMLGEAEVFHRTAKISKAHRWLGFVQGVMTSAGYATVEQLKLANMPEGETFEEGRV